LGYSAITIHLPDKQKQFILFVYRLPKRILILHKKKVSNK